MILGRVRWGVYSTYVSRALRHIYVLGFGFPVRPVVSVYFSGERDYAGVSSVYGYGFLRLLFRPGSVRLLKR